jgi:hypothetical protein
MTYINSYTAPNARWLTLRQAVSYCPYGTKKLIRLAKEGKIKGGQLRDNKNAWFFDRLSIDDYMESQLISDEIEQKAIDFVRRLS